MKAEKYYYDFQNKLNKVSGLEELLGEKISGDVKFDYDPRGNVTNITEGRKTLGHYEFNKENLLKTATNNKGETTEFKYDGLNRRIGLKIESPEKRVIKEYSYVNDATTPYNSILMRYEKDLNSYKPQTESYIHGFGLESKETTNTWGEKKKNYYSHNELGSITREYNQEGNTTNSYEYDLFGVPSFREDTHSYTSYTHDQSTGLMYAQARYYLPEVGRFISEDSYKGTLPDPESQNRYVYCVSNPLRYVDPDGHEIIKLFSGLLEVGKGNIDFSDLNYSYRMACNEDHPTFEQCTPQNGWTRLPKGMSVYHDNGIGKPEIKFTLANGREAVFDGDTHEIVYDSKYFATYNFVSPMKFNFMQFIGCSGEFFGKNAGHFLFDMVPYYIGGNTPEEFTWNPLIWLDRTGIPNKVSEAYYGFMNPIKDGAMQYLNDFLSPKK